MKFELTQRFYFESAHTLTRQVDTESSQRIHGHTYIAEVTVAGLPEPTTGMVVDLADLRAAIQVVRDQLDHRLLDEVPGVGAPTLENLCAYLWHGLNKPQWQLAQVVVKREASGDACCLRDEPKISL
jgi:6-pyruvoyltetrahydropterin/6-carboxytetrahydropterin synthase